MARHHVCEVNRRQAPVRDVHTFSHKIQRDISRENYFVLFVSSLPFVCVLFSFYSLKTLKSFINTSTTATCVCAVLCEVACRVQAYHISKYYLECNDLFHFSRVSYFDSFHSMRAIHRSLPRMPQLPFEFHP